MNYKLTIECDDIAQLTDLVIKLDNAAANNQVAATESKDAIATKVVVDALESKPRKSPKPRTKDASKMVVVSQTEAAELEGDFVEEETVEESQYTVNEVGRALKNLMDTVDRASVTKIFKKYKVLKTADIPEKHYAEVMQDVENALNPPVGEDASDSLFEEEESAVVPEMAMIKKAAKVMSAESRRDFKTLLAEYNCADGRSLVNLTDEDKIGIFAKMNAFLGAIED